MSNRVPLVCVQNTKATSVPATRSKQMSLIRSRGNRSTEAVFASILRRQKVSGWRRHAVIKMTAKDGSRITVRPDFVFREKRIAVFVDGCFWHGCKTHCRMPKSRRSFWQSKIKGNQRRDARVSSLLRRNGWKVLRVWEHSLKGEATEISRRLNRLLAENQFYEHLMLYARVSTAQVEVGGVGSGSAEIMARAR